MSSERILYIVIPLLREQRVIEDLFNRFVVGIELFKEITLVFVTTEREVLEASNDSQIIGTTMDSVRQLIAQYEGPRDRILHLHYPKFNSVVAEQLNYAFEELATLPGPPLDQRYIAVYNADSVVDSRSFQLLLTFTELAAPVSQQSSLFLWNVPQLARNHRYHVAAYGLYQSCWTLVHEIPRYLFSRRYFQWLPEWLEQNSLVHCVGHGLLLRLDVLKDVNGIPVSKIGGEDLAMGLVLKVHGYNIEPVPFLENAETPDSYKVFVRQVAGWFLGSLGYLIYWKYVTPVVRRTYRARTTIITALGLWNTVKWLLKGPVLLATFSAAYLSGHLGITLIAYFMYVYIPVFMLVAFWRKLDSKLFPQPSASILPAFLVYPMVPILHSIPAFIGIWWGCKVLFGKSFLKPKTER